MDFHSWEHWQMSVTNTITNFNHNQAQYVHIVRKLDDANSELVNSVVSIVERVAEEKGLKIEPNSGYIRHKKTLIVAVGGDGTMLQAMNVAALYNCIVLGVNLGQVGFLTDYPNNSTLYQALSEVFDGGAYLHPIERRMGLEYREDQFGHPNKHTHYTAFNEFVISNRYSDHHIRYTLSIDGAHAGSHKANSLIVGTPTGSTAYTLSVGGSLMLPSLEAIQIIPVAPFSMTSRPIIVPADSEICVEVETKGEWILKRDGETISSGDSDSGKIRIHRSKSVASILHPKGWNFFDVLSNKLAWIRDR